MISNKFLHTFPEFGVFISLFDITDQFSRVFGSFMKGFHKFTFNRMDLKILEVIRSSSNNIKIVQELDLGMKCLMQPWTKVHGIFQHFFSVLPIHLLANASSILKDQKIKPMCLI